MATRRRTPRDKEKSPQVQTRLILDSGAVIALARKDLRTSAIVQRAIDARHEVLVPAVVIAETIRGHGPRDAPVNRVLNAIGASFPTDESPARTAGSLLGKAKSRGTIDALVVAAAIHAGGGRILTSDPSDLAPLASGRREVSILAV